MTKRRSKNSYDLPNSTPSKKGKQRDAFADLEDIEIRESPAAYSNQTGVRPLRKYQERQSAFKYLLRYLVVRDIDPDSPEHSHPSLIEALQEQYLQQIKDGGLQLLNDFAFWTVFLHYYAITGQGLLNEFNIAHVNTINRSYASSSDYSTSTSRNPEHIVTDSLSEQSLGDEEVDEQSDIENNHEDDDDVNEDQPFLDEDELNIVKDLPIPDGSCNALSLVTIRSMIYLVTNHLKDEYQFEIDDKALRKAKKIIAYNAYEKKWYPTAFKNKTWITDQQIDQILSAVFNVNAMSSEARTPVYKLVSIHTAINCLDVLGVRQTSLLDSKNRGSDGEGRYLRWSHVRIRLIGYEDLEAQFVVYSTVSGTKASKKYGDEKFQNFCMGTRKSNGQIKSPRDLAMMFVIQAVIQGAMGENLQKVILDQEFGNILLSQSSNGFYEFRCMETFKMAPVFINIRPASLKPVSNTSDNSPLDVKACPLSSCALGYALNQYSAAIGLDENLQYTCFRISHSLRGQTNSGSKIWKAWELTADMAHESGNKDLVRHTYRPTHFPIDAVSNAFGGWTASLQVANSIQKIDSMTYRPDPAKLSVQQIENLRTCMNNHTAGYLSDQELMATYQHVNGGRRKSLGDSKLGIKYILENDDWPIISRMTHPFTSVCDDKLSKIVRWLLNGGAYACPCCLEPHIKKRTDKECPRVYFPTSD